MKRIGEIILLVGLMILVAVIASFKIMNIRQKEIDIIALNTIAKTAEQEWSNLERLQGRDFEYEFNVLDRNGEMLFRSDNMPQLTLEEAIRQGQSCINILEGDRLLGIVIAYTYNTEPFLKQKKEVVQLVIGMILLEILLLIGYGLRNYHYMIKPFHKLKAFAHEVAKGNLDFPLEMDKGHVFGEFTESFDLMREELKLARKKEYEANVSKKELIAELSHDIKTPVTGIKLISELLELQVKEPEVKEKVHTIYNKAQQINELITDMFQSTLDELGELKVELKDEFSTCLQELCKSMDYEGLLKQGEVPECMIYIDLLRMEQVINNIISNSYKYAKTEIDVRYSNKGDYLQVEVKDYGKGIPEEEIPLVFNKFYRGKGEAVQAQVGAGLGLYISKNLMEKMGGEMSCYNAEDGFVVRLLIPLSSGSLME
ncbi:MAG: HAMP domain-containing histidine kinase [Cellulosilyticum sp.]|nr:HAMP domain-containing histidine kinase [Cellulosilyticum sp.]